MELKDVEELLKTFDQSDAMALDWSEEDFQIHLSKREQSDTLISGDTLHQASASDSTAEVVESGALEQHEKTSVVDDQELDTGQMINSPMVGLVYLSPSPDDATYKAIGDTVEVGDVLCTIEAMKMFTEVKSTIKGTLTEILVSDGDMVEYDQPLMKVSETK